MLRSFHKIIWRAGFKASPDNIELRIIELQDWLYLRWTNYTTMKSVNKISVVPLCVRTSYCSSSSSFSSSGISSGLSSPSTSAFIRSNWASCLVSSASSVSVTTLGCRKDTIQNFINELSRYWWFPYDITKIIVRQIISNWSQNTSTKFWRTWLNWIETYDN